VAAALMEQRSGYAPLPATQARHTMPTGVGAAPGLTPPTRRVQRSMVPEEDLLFRSSSEDFTSGGGARTRCVMRLPSVER
jgi:hypothetical protein